MARYYCEYCHSYLTHDTLSVRKSHLVGKNHLRITADYYRNKARDHDRGMFSRKKSHSSGQTTAKSVPIHCSTNKEKKAAAALGRAHKKELQSREEDILSKLYDGSPGYSKVFIDANRLDIGDLVRSNRLPQRANAASDHPQQVRTRNETVVSTHAAPVTKDAILEPPFILTQWSSTVPKTRMYNDNGNSLIKTVNDSKRRILKRKKH